MRVLVIEDDSETASYIRNGLTEEGHTVDTVPDGRDGLLQATTEDYDVIIVDRMLPGVDGLHLVRTLRGVGKQIPVLFLTSLGGVDDRVNGLEAGGDDYVTKPFAFSELLARLHALARRRSRDGSGAPHRPPRRPDDRSAAARVSPARIPDAQPGPHRHPDDAARARLGFSLRSQDQRRRNPYFAPARQDRPPLRQRLDPHHQGCGLQHPQWWLTSSTARR